MQRFLNAYYAAKNSHNSYWIARSAEKIGDIFYISYSYNQAIHYSKEAIINYREAGQTEAERYAISDLAFRFSQKGEHNKAFKILDSLINITTTENRNNKQLIDYIQYHLALVNIRLKKDPNYESSHNNPLSDTISESLKITNVIYKAEIENNISNPTQSIENLLLKLKNETTNKEEKVQLLYAMYKRANAKGDYKYAATLTDSLIQIQSFIADSLLQESVLGVQNDFYHSKAEEEHAVSVRKNWIILITVLSGLLLTAACIIVYQIKLKRKAKEIAASVTSLANMTHEFNLQKEQINSQLEQISQKDAELMEKENEVKQLMTELAEHINTESKHNELVRELFATKWSTLNSLCNEYDAWKENSGVASKIYTQFCRELDKLRSAKGMRELEQMVNQYNQGLMTHFRAEVPGLKEYTYQLMILSAAGFEPRVGALLLNIEKQNFYLRRRRLRERLDTLKPPHLELYLRYLAI